jgi:hypothetical protein
MSQRMRCLPSRRSPTAPYGRTRPPYRRAECPCAPRCRCRSENVRAERNMFVGASVRNRCEVRFRFAHEHVIRRRAVGGVPTFPATHRFAATLRTATPQARFAKANGRNVPGDSSLAFAVTAHGASQLRDDADRLVAKRASRPGATGPDRFARLGDARRAR